MTQTPDEARREVFFFFHAGPVSLNTIEPNFLLGNLSAATDISTIMKYKITHILTIDTCPLPRQVLELKHLTTKFIQLSDLPKEDLLKHLDETRVFIDDGLKNGVVLVHCYYGVSRSATVVIAYIMHKYRLSYSEALKKFSNQTYRPQFQQNQFQFKQFYKPPSNVFKPNQNINLPKPTPMSGISSIKNYFHEINPESVIFNEETNQYYAPVNLEQFDQINPEQITNDEIINEYDETEPEVNFLETSLTTESS
ncbi:hypothetical protein RN001_008298 [Aquatica leii]|uniref:Protein-tyrosine-phosphatase n=1 Tax=Aquatica leii TaxID=1421715 RepID=A0AAN7P9G8_9COLE|nr:hypothetical protein RN001_008298 [Aquatica leii]